VLPSIILVGVFVYGFIGKTVFASLARVKTKSGLTLFMMKSPDFLGDEERYIAPLM
jgi:hypothetical protein